MAIWIVRYEHRHGTDVWCTETKEEAEHSCVTVVLDYVGGEVDEPEKIDQILALIREEKFWDAVKVYSAATGESFTLTEQEGFRDEPSVQMLRARAEEKIRLRASRTREA